MVSSTRARGAGIPNPIQRNQWRDDEKPDEASFKATPSTSREPVSSRKRKRTEIFASVPLPDKTRRPAPSSQTNTAYGAQHDDINIPRLPDAMKARIAQAVGWLPPGASTEDRARMQYVAAMIYSGKINNDVNGVIAHMGPMIYGRAISLHETGKIDRGRSDFKGDRLIHTPDTDLSLAPIRLVRSGMHFNPANGRAPADGHCLFHSLASELKRLDGGDHDYRSAENEAVRHIARKWPDLNIYLPDLEELKRDWLAEPKRGERRKA